MFKTNLLLLFFVLLLTGCLFNNNGTYVVYKASAYNPKVSAYIETNWDSDASIRLAQRFQGKKYSLEFTDKYVILKEESSKEDIFLNKDKGEFANSPTENLPYVLEYVKAGEKIHVSLYNRMATEAKSIELYVKVYTGETDDEIVDDKFALIKCELEKR